MPPIESNAGGDPQLLGSPDLTNGPEQLDRGYETGTITKKLSVSLELMQIPLWSPKSVPTNSQKKN